MGTLLAVAAGGALGAATRYGLGGWIQRVAGSAFPWGTLTINVTGSFALGLLVIWLDSTMSSSELRAFLTVGVLGGFTTFSTFSYEAVAMAQNGAWGRAATYAVLSLVLGLVAMIGGMAIARAWLRGVA